MESNGSLATPNDQSLGVRLVGGIIHLKEGQRIISATEQGAWPIQMPAPRSRALERFPVMFNRSHGRACRGHPRLSRRPRKKDVDAREDLVPAACRGGVSLRGHDG